MSAVPLDYFLGLAKEALQDARSTKQQLTLVIGNAHPDIDSIASSVIFAYFRTANPPEGAWSPCYIPVLNEYRSELLHQPLLMRVLPHASITVHDLFTPEDLVMRGTQSGLQEDLVRFFFVDHNLTLGREKQNYSQKVVGCIDHNPDEGYVPQHTAPEPRMIVPAGSCTSLVVNFSRRTWEGLEFDIPGLEFSLAKLALAAILVDTKDLTTSVTDEDISAVEFLLSRIKISNSRQDFDRTNYYYEIIGEERPRPMTPEVQDVPERKQEVIPEPTNTEPVFVEAEKVEPQTFTDPEPVVEVQPEAVPEVEHLPEPEPEVTPEPIPEPAPKEPIFIDTSPVVEAQPEQHEELVAEAQSPVETPSTTQLVTVRSPYPRVYLADVLAHDFEQGFEGGGAIGITFTRMGLAEMVLHAERDLVERAIEAAADGPESEERATNHVLSGTPFSAAVSEFALERGLSVYAIRTDLKKGNELFIWVFSPFMEYFIPRFVQTWAGELGLEKWGKDEDVITKETLLNQGMMGVYWMRTDTGRENVKKAIMGGQTYVFFGNGNGSAPKAPPRPPRRSTKSSGAVATA